MLELAGLALAFAPACPLEYSRSENRRFNVPIRAGVALAVVGGGLPLSGKK